MARFLKHTACPVCGSSDALGHYDDGSTYCFSHGRSTKSASLSPYVTTLREQEEDSGQKSKIIFPSDATQDYPLQALAWASKYEIGVQDFLSNQVYYSPARNQVIFRFNDGEGRVVAWQARNLNPVSKAKRYYTQGDVNNVLPIYHCRNAHSDRASGMVRRLVLVEDCLSAIKVASVEALGADAMPLLGSSLPKSKLTALRASYDLCDVFLDPDMWPKSLLITKQAEMLGFKVRSIRADCDPKELAREQLQELLATNA